MYVEHCFSPIFDEHSRILILGTMPSPASRELGFYYSHPRNRFWQVMTAITNAPSSPVTPAEKQEFALRHGFALWDVLAACNIAGASDASISSPVPNDLDIILEKAPIEAICTTGITALRLYRKFNAHRTLPIFGLPSTSPANAKMSMDDLIAAYTSISHMLKKS